MGLLALPVPESLFESTDMRGNALPPFSNASSLFDVILSQARNTNYYGDSVKPGDETMISYLKSRSSYWNPISYTDDDILERVDNKLPEYENVCSDIAWSSLKTAALENTYCKKTLSDIYHTKIGRWKVES
jgi:hypothetical protein